MELNIATLYEEITAQLRAAELKAAELRGQLQLIERLMIEAQRPVMSGDPLDAPPNGREVHTGPLV